MRKIILCSMIIWSTQQSFSSFTAESNSEDTRSQRSTSLHSQRPRADSKLLQVENEIYHTFLKELCSLFSCPPFRKNLYTSPTSPKTKKWEGIWHSLRVDEKNIGLVW